MIAYSQLFSSFRKFGYSTASTYQQADSDLAAVRKEFDKVRSSVNVSSEAVSRSSLSLMTPFLIQGDVWGENRAVNLVVGHCMACQNIYTNGGLCLVGLLLL